MLSRRLLTLNNVRRYSSSTELLERELYLDNQVVRLVFNSPKNRNALSLEFMSLLQKELNEIDKIEKIRAIILAANGPAFSAGHDLKQLVRGIYLNLNVF
jgi:enoyl-CoA hydratase/carnithine racemase